jgi:hypothetical protein
VRVLDDPDELERLLDGGVHVEPEPAERLDVVPDAVPPPTWAVPGAEAPATAAAWMTVRSITVLCGKAGAAGALPTTVTTGAGTAAAASARARALAAWCC